MKAALYLATAIAIAAASPSGYYHQEYNYKTSASSYRNNELQHKTDDQGYYSKDGDLEGRVKPKVSANSEHSEYVNPRSHGQGNAGYYDAGSDLMSHGNMLANSYGASVGGQVASGYRSGSQYENNLNSEGLASSDYIGGASGYSGSYSAGSEAAYETANLRTLGSSLQTDLQRELQSALLSRAHQVDVAELEAELRRNLTARLGEVLQDRFGAQTIRGGQSYSLAGGRVQPRPNYEQRELEQLQRQIEQSLLQELRQGYNYRSSHSSHQRVDQNYERFESTTTYRPTTPYSYRPIYPNLNTQNQYTYGEQSHRNEYNINRASSNVEFTQVPNAVSITTIASNVQRELNERLNRLLEQAQRQYFSEDSRFDAYSTAPILDRLKQEVRQNLTYSLDEELRRHFGTQSQRNGYMFSVRQNGETTNQYNYNIADLDSLRRQVEENLITKLARDFEAARQHWITRQQHSQSQQNVYRQTNTNNYITSNNLGYEYSTPAYSTPRYAAPIPSTPRYSEDDYYRPTSGSIIPLISSGIKGNQHHVASGSHLSSYQTSGSSSNIAQLQQHLQSDLSNQLQAALSQNRAYAGRYSAAGEGQASFDEAYRRLYEELQRNLTQQLQSFESGSSAYSRSYGGVSEHQLAELRSQLQRSLASQLQQGLQQSYSASATYSASSGSSASAGGGAYSSSNSGGYYRAARGSDSYDYGQYRGGGGYLVEGADCQGDDPLAHQFHRAKRSYSGYRSRPLGLSSHAGGGYDSRGTYGGYSGYGTYTPVGQEEDDSEITQPRPGYSVGINQARQNIGQEIDETDDTQQIEVDHGFNIGQAPDFGSQVPVGQEEDDTDNTQQIEVDHGFGSIGLGSQNFAKPSSPKPNISEIGGSVRGNTQINDRPLYQETPYLGAQGGSGYIRPYSQTTDRSRAPQTSLYGSPISQGGYYPDGSQRAEHTFGNVGSGNRDTERDYRFNSRRVGQTVNPPINTDIDKGINLSPPRATTELNHRQVAAGYHRYVPTTERNNYFIGQEEDNEDTQQVEIDSGFATADLNKQNSQVDMFDVTTPLSIQRGPTGRPGRSQTANVDSSRPITTPVPQRNVYRGTSEKFYPKNNLGQQTDDTDDVNVDSLKPQNNLGQEIDDTDLRVDNLKPLGQQIDDTDTYVDNLKPHNNLGQQVDDFDSIQKPLPTVFASTSKPNKSNQPETNWNQFGTSPRPTLESGGFHISSTPENPFLLQFGTQNVIPQSESVQPLSNNFDTKPNKSNQPETNWNQFGTSPRPTLETGSFHISSTPRNPFLLEFGTKNVIPESESVQPLSNNFDTTESSSFRPLVLLSSSQNPISANPGGFNIQPNRLAGPQLNYFDDVLRPTTPTIRPVHTNIGNTLLPTAQPIQPVISSTPQVDIPVELKEVSTQLEANLTSQIEDIVKNELPFSTTPDQLYQNTLYELRANITRECQKLLEDTKYSHLNIYQRDVTILEKYVESHLIQKLNQKFQISGYVTPATATQQSLNFNNNYYGSNRGYEQLYGYRRRPQMTSNTFLEREINSQDNTYQVNQNPYLKPVQFEQTPNPLTPVRPLESDSFVDQNRFPQTSPQQISSEITSTTTYKPTPRSDLTPGLSQPLPTQTSPDRRALNEAENEADLLIQRLRTSIQNRERQSSFNQQQSGGYNRQYDGHSPVAHNPQPQSGGVIRVKLENLTPEQLNIINGIENDFSDVIDIAVQNDYASRSLDHISKYQLYQLSLNRLEQELRRNISESIEGRGQNLENVNLKVYFNLLNQKFEQQKIADVQKYLEIRLIKKIRVQLKRLYNIEATEETSARTQEFTSQKPRYETRVIRLENITPAQLKVIRQIEDEINAQIESVIQIRIASLRESQASSYSYQQSLDTLELELKNKIIESVQRLCEPGLSQYSQLVATNFDSSKINDLEKYLEVRLVNKLKENIVYYSKTESSANSRTSYHSTSSLNHYGQSNYHSYPETDGSLTRQDSSNYPPPSVNYPSPVNSLSPASAVPSSTTLGEGAVKGGRHRSSTYLQSHNIQTSEEPLISSNPDAEILPKVPNEITNNLESTEATTPSESWWTRFGKKVKQGATNLKDKISGKS